MKICCKKCCYSGKVNSKVICRKDMTYRAETKERKCAGFKEVNYFQKILMKYGRGRYEDSLKTE